MAHTALPGLLLAALLLAGLTSAAAAPPGHVVESSRLLVATRIDLKDGTGIADPTDPYSP
jgi:hypothetical protein